MSNLVFAHQGQATIYLKYVGDGTSTILNTATGLDDYVKELKTPYIQYFSAGQSASLVDGVTLTGQTSGAVLHVERVLITQGTLGGSDACGVLFCKSITGTVTAGENLRVSTTTYCVAVESQKAIPKGLFLKHITMQVENNNLRVLWDGLSPTNSAATPASWGLLVQANENLPIAGYHNCCNLKMINAVAGSYGYASLLLAY